MKDILSLIEYYKKNQPKNHNNPSLPFSLNFGRKVYFPSYDKRKEP